MMEILLTKTTATGTKIEVVLLSAHVAGVLINGQIIDGGCTAPIKLQTPRGAITHRMGDDKQAVPLTTAEARIVLDAIALPPVKVADPATTWMGEPSMDAADSIF